MRSAELLLISAATTGTERAVIAGLSCGALWGTLLAAEHPERVSAVAYIGPAVSLAPGHAERLVVSAFEQPLDTD